jgi:hypothetical protein
LNRADQCEAAGHDGSYQQQNRDNHIHYYFRPPD